MEAAPFLLVQLAVSRTPSEPEGHSGDTPREQAFHGAGTELTLPAGT